MPAGFRPRFRWKGDQVIVDLPDDEQQILAHVLVQLRELVMGETGPVIGTHAGPGLVGLLAFQPTEEEAELLAPLG